MAHLVRLPAMGQSMEEGTILHWLKAEGDSIQKGEPLVEIMTDKANMEVESPASGVLLKLLQPADATVPVQDPLCVIGEPGEDWSAAAGESTPIPPEYTPQKAETPSAPEQKSSSGSVPSAHEAIPDLPTGPILSTPRARKLAQEHGIDMAELFGTGTGPQGRIIERDIRAYLETLLDQPVRITPLAQRMAAQAGIEPRELVGSGPGGKVRSDDVRRATEPSESLVPPVEIPEVYAAKQEKTRKVPLSKLRRLIADNITRSAQTAPHVTLTMEVDATELVRLRTTLLPTVEKRYGVRLTYTDLIVKATATALLEHPWLNSSFADDSVILYGDVHMGVAVAIPDGLVVPVVRNADAKGLPAISAEIKELAGRARENRLKPDEMMGGTFTITNLGGYGIDFFTPIINPPQCAILGVGRIVERPAFGPNGGVEARSFMTLSLSFDHRVVDGVPAAEFLRTLRELLENPTLILV